MILHLYIIMFDRIYVLDPFIVFDLMWWLLIRVGVRSVRLIRFGLFGF